MTEPAAEPPKVNGAPPDPATQVFKEGEKPAVAAEPTLAERRAKLSGVAAAERSKLAARQRAEQERQQLSARAEQAEANARQLQAQLDQALADSKLDPLELLEKRGITPRMLGERILKRGTPEEGMAQAMAAAKAAEDKADALRAELQQREARAQHENRVMGARRQLQDTFEGIKAELPILGRLVKDYASLENEYMRAYQRIMADPVASQAGFSDAEILQAWEQVRRAELEEALDGYDIEALDAHLTKRRGSANLAEKAEPASGAQGTKAATVGRTGKTLAAVTTSGKSGSWKPDNWHKLSDKAQNKLIVERLEKGLPLD